MLSVSSAGWHENARKHLPARRTCELPEQDFTTSGGVTKGQASLPFRGKAFGGQGDIRRDRMQRRIRLRSGAEMAAESATKSYAPSLTGKPYMSFLGPLNSGHSSKKKGANASFP